MEKQAPEVDVFKLLLCQVSHWSQPERVGPCGVRVVGLYFGNVGFENWKPETLKLIVLVLFLVELRPALEEAGLQVDLLAAVKAEQSGASQKHQY
jgi:hypothetical protein